MIDVQHDQTEWTVFPNRPVQFGLSAGIERPAVQQVCQGVEGGHLFQALFSFRMRSPMANRAMSSLRSNGFQIIIRTGLKPLQKLFRALLDAAAITSLPLWVSIT
jgi:hypothetical protein